MTFHLFNVILVCHRTNMRDRNLLTIHMLIYGFYLFGDQNRNMKGLDFM